MDNKLSLHIVWPFVILWIIVCAMVGGDLIPLHVTDKMGSAGKVAWMMEELLPSDDVVPVDELDMSQIGVVDDTQIDAPVDNQEAFDRLAEDIVDDAVADPVQDEALDADQLEDSKVLIDIPVEDMGNITYILNTNSMKFHNIGCYSAELIAPENFEASFDTRDTVLANGYVPCENCNP